jgi:hypothetical protein
MAGQTQMIVITSNEDLIRKLSSNRKINKQIIELDDEEQNNNIINLPFLAELSELVRI